MVSREGKELLEEGLQGCSPNARVATADKTEVLSLLREKEDSSGSISIAGFWSESKSEDENCPWLTESCSAVLEPSKDDSRDSVGNPQDIPGDFFTLSCPAIITDEESTRSKGEPTNPEDAQQSSSERRNSNEKQSSNKHHSNNEHHSSEQNSNQQPNSGEHDTSNEQQNSNEQNSNEQQNSNDQNGNQQQNSNEQNSNEPNSNEQNSNEQNSNEQNSNEQQNSNVHQNINEQQTDQPNGNCCATFLDCYSVNSRKITDSRFIYIFQLFVSLLSVSEIVMGIIFYGSCDPQPSPIPVIAILMAISGLALVYNWFVKVRRHRRGEYYWNFERNVLSVFLAIFLFLLTLEVAFFTQASPKPVQSTEEVKCIKAYYDYLYYMFFAIGGSLALAASLYLPDCCIYTFTYQAPLPSHANGHYQPL